MAVNLLVLPLSRYWSGSFFIPEMLEMWARGLPARFEAPDGTVVERAPGVPFGGEDAAERRHELLRALPAYLDSLPHGIAAEGWDEASDAEHPVHSIEHADFASLLDVARRELEATTFLRRVFGHYTTASHLVNARVFVGVRFEKAFKKGDDVFGSLPILEDELNRVSPRLDAGGRRAEAAFRAGLAVAQEMGLPLIVDV